MSFYTMPAAWLVSAGCFMDSAGMAGEPEEREEFSVCKENVMSSIPVPAARRICVEADAALDVLGVTVTPLVSNAETGEQFGMFHAVVPPGVGIPVHSHPDVEMFFVLEGELRISRRPGEDAEAFTVGANQGGFIPCGALHGFVNAGEKTARLLITCTKGLEDFLVEAGRPLSGDAAKSMPLEIERVLAIARRHGQVFPGVY